MIFSKLSLKTDARLSVKLLTLISISNAQTGARSLRAFHNFFRFFYYGFLDGV